ncbi:hypothetical protein [Serratia fonticola]|uniref:hypothetical protein n=1 Tax=Serratia fonticola TaxID=47917 RepID=UPI0021BB2C33|nr:hypothetical protein [Serratia fonticola]
MIERSANLDIKVFDSASGEGADVFTQYYKGTLSHGHYSVSGIMLRNSFQVTNRGAIPKPKGTQLAIYTKKALHCLMI